MERKIKVVQIIQIQSIKVMDVEEIQIKMTKKKRTKGLCNSKGD